MRAPWARTGGRVLSVVGVVLALVAVRVVTASQSELAEGERLEQAGDLDAAIVHYRRAARWYAPGNPYSTDALEKLARVAASDEAAGESERALVAYRAIRSGILSTRSFYVPHEAELDAANARIAALMAKQPPPPIDAGKSEEELRAEHLALLAAPTRPHVGWTIALLLGFALWVGGAFAFASRAIDEEDRLLRKEALRWGGTFAAGLALFVLGMALA